MHLIVPAVRPASLNVFELLRISLINVRGSKAAPEDDPAFHELKDSVVRAAAELSVRRDPHHERDSSGIEEPSIEKTDS
jgi:hypothetical protein